MIRLLSLAALALTLATPLRAAIDIQPITSPDGHEIWLVEDRSIPFVSIEVIFEGGASIEAPEQAGVVSLMTALLSEGAGDLDAQDFAAALEATAGSISFNAGRDSVSMSIRALTENRDAVIDLAILALTAPQFTPEAVARVRDQQVAALSRQAQQPATLAAAAFNAMGYAGHPYGIATDGTPETVSGLDRDAIVAAHEASFARNRVYVGAAGDIGAEDLAALIDRLLAGLPESDVPLPEYRSLDAPAGVTLVPNPGPQSYVLFGLPGLRLDDPDYMAAMIVSQHFGGAGFGSRLMTELRERRGLTYGVSTQLSSGQFGDAFLGAYSTDNANVAESLDLVRAEFAQLAEQGLTQADMDRAVTYLTGAYPLRFTGNSEIAQIMAAMQFQDFDLDYVNVRNDLMRAVTLEQVNAMAARLARTDALTIVVAGTPEGLD